MTATRKPPAAHTALIELAGHFARLGITAFGGPVAHVAIMQDEFVRRRRWLDPVTFARAFAATNLVPGPNSTEMAIHLGFQRRGLPGGIIAGIAFILPSVLTVAILAWAYFRWGTTPHIDELFSGIRPVVIALVILALWRLRNPVVHNPLLVMLAIFSFAVSLLTPHLTTLALLVSGVIALLANTDVRIFATTVMPASMISFARPSLAINLPEAIPIAAIHLKAGALLFGGGFAIIPLLGPDAIAQSWLTEEQFLDAIAIGQITPGPIVTTATFVGYAAGGWSGAIVATLAIFAPSFIFGMSLSNILQRLTSSKNLRTFLDGVAAAVFGTIAGTGVLLLLALDLNPLTVTLLAASVVVLLRSLLPTYAWIACCGMSGLLYSATGFPT
jgi:chromate transporter